MKITMLPITAISPYEKNPRKNDGHNKAVDKVAASLKAFGFRQPIVVDKDMVIVVGHTRYKAAQKLGLAKIPIHVAADLSPTMARQYRLADNRTGQEAKWDTDLLAGELDALRQADADMSLTGFDERELLVSDGSDEDADRNVREEENAKLQAKWGTKVGQLWEIGDHRLLIGDCTTPENWNRLMDGAKAALCNTYPPYGVTYTQPTATALKWKPIEGDRKREDNLLASLLTPALRLAVEHTEPDAAFYIWHASSTRRDFEAALDAAGLEEKQYITWVKEAIVLGHADYHWQTEPAFYCQKAGESCRWTGDRAQSTVWRVKPPSPCDMAISIANGIRLSDDKGSAIFVSDKAPKARKTRLIRVGAGETVSVLPEHSTDAWEIARDKAADRHHPTQKPVRLFVIPILNHTKPADVVADPFSGSGSQFLAADETNRACFGMELDPKYAAVILERLSTIAGRIGSLKKGSK